MIPRLYIRDANDKTIATLDDGDYFDDTLTRYLAGKASVFEFSIYKNDGDYELFKAGKKVSFNYEDEDFWLNMMITEQNETTLTITAVSLSLELNNETVGAHSGTSKSFVDYFNDMINFEHSLTIGINEVSDKRISNEWTGTSTLLARLFSLATVFSAEVEFVTELADNGSLKNIVVNVYKEHSDTNQGLGVNRTSETFRFGSEITTVQKSEDISGIYTAIFPKGTDGLTIKDVEHEVLDDMGNILYCTYKTAKTDYPDVKKIYAPQSRDLFPSTITGSDRWIVNGTDELQYTSAEALYGYALGQLKQYSVPQTKWEISGYITARIGDTIRVADDGYKPEIYLNARITEQSISFTDPSKNKSTFSNVVELKSEVNADLLKIAEQLKKEINYVLSTTVDYQVSDQGKTVPTGDWVTDLPTTQPGEWLWIRTAQSMSNGTSVVGYTKARNGMDGGDGVSPEITVNPDTSLTITDKNGTQTTPKLRGPKGDQGIMGVAYAQPTAPINTQEGATWFKTKSATDNSVLGIYTLIGTTWTETPVTADALAVTSLSAISANLGTVNAGTINGITINGSEFVNAFDRETVEGGPYIKGTTTIGDGRYRVEYQTYAKSTGAVLSKGRTFIDESGQVTSRLEDPSGNALYTASIGPSGIMLNDFYNGYSGSITAENLEIKPWINLTLESGYEAKEGDTPQYRRIKLLDGSYEVQLHGKVGPVGKSYQIVTGVIVATLPADCTPVYQEMFPVAGSNANYARMQVAKNGTLQVATKESGVSYVSLSGTRFIVGN